MFNPSDYYKGFSIKEALGNNRFSFVERKQKQIYVAPLKQGNLNDLSIGQNTAFSESVDGLEHNYPGLKYFIHLELKGKEIFIFDNHNHAFFFWIYAFNKDLIQVGDNLVHVDQHTDMRKPDQWLTKEDILSAAKVFKYTNFALNVGNFIQPALKLKLFNKIEIIDSSFALQKSFNDRYVLDLDMDFFSDDMAYIPDPVKIHKIRDYFANATFITIATSPYFMDQVKAIKIIKDILG